MAKRKFIISTADKIDYFLEDQKKSRRRLALEVGISPTTFQSAMERGGNMQVETLMVIAHNLGVPFEALVNMQPFPNWIYVPWYLSAIKTMVKQHIGTTIDNQNLDLLNETAWFCLFGKLFDSISFIDDTSDKEGKIYITYRNVDDIKPVSIPLWKAALDVALSNLNEAGREKVSAYAFDLSKIPEYRNDGGKEE